MHFLLLLCGLCGLFYLCLCTAAAMLAPATVTPFGGLWLAFLLLGFGLRRGLGFGLLLATVAR